MIECATSIEDGNRQVRANESQVRALCSIFTENDEYCPAITIEADTGSVSQGSRILGGSAFIECAEGYRVSNVTAKELVCKQSTRLEGVWEPEVPSCMGKSCLLVCDIVFDF